MLLNLEELVKKYNLSIKGVAHIGAHKGTEYSIYKKLGIENFLFFEPLYSNYKELIKIVPQHYCHNVALGHEEGFKTLFVEKVNNGQSCSLLKPKLHLSQYPYITFDDKVIVPVRLLDEYPLKNINFINIDVQGYELKVFQGAKESLKNIDYIMTEVNRAELYEDCVIVDDLDWFLKDYGFKRVETTWDGFTWGDALYIKNDKL